MASEVGWGVWWVDVRLVGFGLCLCIAQSGVDSGVAGSVTAAHVIALSRGVVNTSLETNGGMRWQVSK